MQWYVCMYACMRKYVVYVQMIYVCMCGTNSIDTHDAKWIHICSKGRGLVDTLISGYKRNIPP